MVLRQLIWYRAHCVANGRKHLLFESEMLNLRRHQVDLTRAARPLSLTHTKAFKSHLVVSLWPLVCVRSLSARDRRFESHGSPTFFPSLLLLTRSIVCLHKERLVLQMWLEAFGYWTLHLADTCKIGQCAMDAEVVMVCVWRCYDFVLSYFIIICCILYGYDDL